MQLHFRYIAILAIGLLSTGCTWVKPTYSSEQVRIVPADRVGDCKKLGDITTYTKATVAGVKRKQAKVRQELETLAKTEAADMQANTIVVNSEVIEGKQTFLAYQCPVAN